MAIVQMPVPLRLVLQPKKKGLRRLHLKDLSMKSLKW